MFCTIHPLVSNNDLLDNFLFLTNNHQGAIILFDKRLSRKKGNDKSNKERDFYFIFLELKLVS